MGEKEADRFVRKTALAAYVGIVLRTPVDTGRARGNWLVSMDKAEREEPIDRKDKPGQETIDTGNRDIAQFDIRQHTRIVLYNNVNYIRYLEDGTSSQAPNGMVKVTLAELESSL